MALMYRYFIPVLLGVAAMACDTSTSTPPDTFISSQDGLPTGSFLLDPIRQICISHLRLTSVQTAKPNNPTSCMSLLNLDVNKYPFNDPDKLSVPTTREFHSANDAIVVATFKALGKLDKEKYKEGWDAVISCAGVLMDLRARDVYLREILPTIESEGIDGWKKTCDEWILKAKTGAQ
ncbi:hypothetical protein J7337_013861 [Fusarium musae]|uniref:Pectinesterase inhibitor domain-containing protein n=1 Tax=Fusarium musae TaxID=1042133 RepID=A0A9P8IFM3_9HYPO|nr:hypothetical protein J7337_013861 [Fusarium musae]KAG9494722.1 hypothetical protein J7337_013861 [Fusarium musae]